RRHTRFSRDWSSDVWLFRSRSVDGEPVGRHRGLAFYTLGQRHGLGIGGIADRPDAPWYVVGKDLERNELIVAQGADHPALFSDAAFATEMHWINGPPASWQPGAELRCSAKTRYRQPDQPCTVVARGGDAIDVHFDTPQRAVTPGQYVVLYDGERCLGGATIERARTRSREAPLRASESLRASATG